MITFPKKKGMSQKVQLMFKKVQSGIEAYYLSAMCLLRQKNKRTTQKNIKILNNGCNML